VVLKVNKANIIFNLLFSSSMIVSLTIVRYKKLLIPFALLAMAVHRLFLVLQKGCTFWKLLGSGQNGTFDLQPDWQQWGLLAVWQSREDFDEFYKRSLIAGWWNFFGVEKWTILLSPLQSHGKWDGKEPFGEPGVANYAGPIAVLTRATIRLNKLKNFWSNVDDVAVLMATAKGYIASFGIGEAPLYRQATFSVWESVDDVKAFAYRSREHSEVIKKTRAENWYSEELFARFIPIATFGTLKGKNPLNDHINLLK
jgi:heme-degrading monooxygenase HmoA